jgi:pimeloyl-ACP methyl ester carboxylesterase
LIAREQQWLQDWLIREVGTSVNAESGRRHYPTAVRAESMIPKFLAHEARRQDKAARAAQAAGHRQSALKLYEMALRNYVEAQHNLFVESDWKCSLMQRGQACMDAIIALASHDIERIAVPFEGKSLPGLLHDGRSNHPLLLYMPGMDGTKETSSVGPLASPLRSRGFRVLSLDGPGQGAARVLSGVCLAPGAFARAVTAALDHLKALGIWDGKAVYVLGSSMGTRWGLEAAVADRRIRGLAIIHACFGDQRQLLYEAPPRFRKIMAFMAGIASEQELADFIAATDLPVDLRVDCPTFIGIGEFDPLTTVAEARTLVARNLRGPSALYVFEDAFHGGRDLEALCGLGAIEVAADWLADLARGRAPASGEFFLSAHDGIGIYSPRPLGRYPEEQEGDA